MLIDYRGFTHEMIIGNKLSISRFSFGGLVAEEPKTGLGIIYQASTR
jgi:hypothetical protein